MSLRATGCPLPALLLASFFRVGLTIVPRSFLLNRTETLATRAMADRESSVALCHGVALKKKKGSVEDRESGVALCHGVALKKKKERDRSRTERAVSLCATGWR